MHRVAIIGAGSMGLRHAQAYVEMPNAELVAVMDGEPEAAEKLGEAHSVRWFSDIDEMFGEVGLDAVDICTPTPTHLNYIKAAAGAGKHVCCEKPLARTIGQAQEAVRVCDEAGVVLFVAHVLRWFPQLRQLSELIKSGAIGDPVVARTSRGSVHPGRWFAEVKARGGVILDLLVHDFDWLRWCFGRVKRVYARGLAEKKALNTDYALVTLRFESGVIAHVEGSWARPDGFVVDVEVAGTEGLLSFSSRDTPTLIIQKKSDDSSMHAAVVSSSPTSASPYQLELEHFITCLEEGRTPDVTGEDGLEAVRIAESALRSIGTGEPVSIA